MFRLEELTAWESDLEEIYNTHPTPKFCANLANITPKGTHIWMLFLSCKKLQRLLDICSRTVCHWESNENIYVRREVELHWLVVLVRVNGRETPCALNSREDMVREEKCVFRSVQVIVVCAQCADTRVWARVQPTRLLIGHTCLVLVKATHLLIVRARQGRVHLKANKTI